MHIQRLIGARPRQIDRHAQRDVRVGNVFHLLSDSISALRKFLPELRDDRLGALRVQFFKRRPRVTGHAISHQGNRAEDRKNEDQKQLRPEAHRDAPLGSTSDAIVSTPELSHRRATARWLRTLAASHASPWSRCLGLLSLVKQKAYPDRARDKSPAVRSVRFDGNHGNSLRGVTGVGGSARIAGSEWLVSRAKAKRGGAGSRALDLRSQRRVPNRPSLTRYSMTSSVRFSRSPRRPLLCFRCRRRITRPVIGSSRSRPHARERRPEHIVRKEVLTIDGHHHDLQLVRQPLRDNFLNQHRVRLQHRLLEFHPLRICRSGHANPVGLGVGQIPLPLQLRLAVDHLGLRRGVGILQRSLLPRLRLQLALLDLLLFSLSPPSWIPPVRCRYFPSSFDFAFR